MDKSELQKVMSLRIISSNSLDLPPNIDRYECCGDGCVPCITLYYHEDLDHWYHKTIKKILDDVELKQLVEAYYKKEKGI